MPGEVSITNEQKIKAVITVETEGGQPAQVDGELDLMVSSGEGTGFPIEREPDQPSNEFRFYIVSSDNPGDTTFVLKGDADLGEGVVEISDTILLHTTGAQAKSFGMSFGEPELKG